MKSTKDVARGLIPSRLRRWLRSHDLTPGWMLGQLKYGAGLNEVIELRPGWKLRCHPEVHGYEVQAFDGKGGDLDQIREFDGFIARCCPGMLLYDIGCHYGCFSLAALHYGGTEAEAVAIDPAPLACRLVRMQARLNRVVERLEVIETALGERRGWLEMVNVGVTPNSFMQAGISSPGAAARRVRVTTLDLLPTRFRRLPTHIKIDVEGWEAAVLRGARDLLSRCSPVLFLELHNEFVRDRGEDPAETLEILKSAGYAAVFAGGQPMSRDAILGRPITRVVAVR